MTNPIQTLFISACILLSLQACSSSPLQSSRLDSAENNIIQAEQALSASQIVAAENYLGTAMAYIATLEDFKKSLNQSELKRYQALKKREIKLSKAVNSRK